MHKKSKKKKNKSHNKNVTTNAHRHTDGDMQNKINHITTQYNDCENALYQFYNNNCFSINTSEDREQFLLTYKNLAKTYTTLRDLIKTEETFSYRHTLIFLSIKYNALFALYARLFNSKDSLLYSSEAIKVLERNLEQLNFKDDWVFQEVIFSILMILRAHYVNNEYAIDHHLFWVKFSAKCDNNIYKLMSVYEFYFSSQDIKESLVDIASIENLHDFAAIYESTVNKLQKKRVNNNLDLSDLLDYLQANLIMFNFNLITHPSSVWHWDKLKDKFCFADSEVKKITFIEFKNYIHKVKDWSDRFIKPAGDLFLEINWDALKLNAKCLARIKELVENWSECLLNSMRLLLIWNQTHESSLENQALKYQIADETIELQAAYLKIAKSLSAYFVCYPKNPIGFDNQTYETEYKNLTDLLESQKNQFICYEKEQIEIQIRSKHNALKLIQKTDIENAIKAQAKEQLHHNKISKKIQNMIWIQDDAIKQEKASESSSEEEFNQVGDDYFTTADQFISQYKYDKAIITYRLALVKAEKDLDSDKQLRALDGLMVCHSRFFSLKLKAVHSMLAHHNNANLPLNSDIILAIQEMILDYDYILDINKRFDELVSRHDSLTNPKITQGVQLIKDNMLDFVNKSQLSMNKAKSICDDLFEKSKIARQRFIYNLGMEKAQELNVNQGMTDIAVYQLGKQVFIQMGEDKVKSGVVLSHFTYDRVLYRQLISCLNILSDSSQAIPCKDVNRQIQIGFFNSSQSESSQKITNGKDLLQVAKLFHATYSYLKDEKYFDMAIRFYSKVEKIFSDTKQNMNKFEVLSSLANIRKTHYLIHPEDPLLHEAMRAHEKAIYFYENNPLTFAKSKGMEEHIPFLTAERDKLYEIYSGIGRIALK